MRDTLTYPEYPVEIDTGNETLDSILVVLDFLSEFLDFYLP
jgi:hypothetical protein